jgi:hypothetical protein
LRWLVEGPQRDSEPTFAKLLLSTGFVERNDQVRLLGFKIRRGVIADKVAVFSYSHNLVSR